MARDTKVLRESSLYACERGEDRLPVSQGGHCVNYCERSKKKGSFPLRERMNYRILLTQMDAEDYELPPRH